eukprot:Em0001g2298a
MNDYRSENSSDVIAPQNCSSDNLTRASGEHSTVLTIFAILEFAIFILKLLLGSVVIYCLYRSKMLRDPVSALMTSVAASLMVLSIPLNLLVGLSVLIDQPTIGSCNIRFLLITVLIITVSQQYLIPFSIGLIATVQFLIIKYGLKRVSTRNVLSAFALLMSLAMGFSIVHIALGLWNATVNQVTGLLFALTRAEHTVRILLLLGHVVPMVITLVTSYMTIEAAVTKAEPAVTKAAPVQHASQVADKMFLGLSMQYTSSHKTHVVALDRGHWIHVTLEGVALDRGHWIHVTLEGVALDRGHWIHVTLEGVALDRGHWIHVTLEGVALDRGHWIHVTLEGVALDRGHWIHVTLEGVALDRGHWIHVTLEGVALDSGHWIHVTLEGVALDRGHWIHVTLEGVALDRGHWIHVTLEGVALDRGHWIHVTLEGVALDRGHWIHVTLEGVALDRGHWIHVTSEGVALDRGHWIHVTLEGVALDRSHWIHVTLEGVTLDRGHWIHVTLEGVALDRGHWIHVTLEGVALDRGHWIHVTLEGVALDRGNWIHVTLEGVALDSCSEGKQFEALASTTRNSPVVALQWIAEQLVQRVEEPAVESFLDSCRV